MTEAATLGFAAGMGLIMLGMNYVILRRVENVWERITAYEARLRARGEL